MNKQILSHHMSKMRNRALQKRCMSYKYVMTTITAWTQMYVWFS